MHLLKTIGNMYGQLKVILFILSGLCTSDWRTLAILKKDSNLGFVIMVL
jgi:hypothetical protein